MNITEFKYQYDSGEKQASVLYRLKIVFFEKNLNLYFDNFFVIVNCYSVGLHTKFELQAMVERMESYELKTMEFTNNDMVKDHLRHLVIHNNSNILYF